MSITELSGNARGYSLLETLVALAISGMVLAMGYDALSKGLRARPIAEDMEQAVSLAVSKMAEVDLAGDWRSLNDSGSRNDELRWRREARLLPDMGNPVSTNTNVIPVEIIVTISWGKESPRNYRLYSVRLFRGG